MAIIFDSDKYKWNCFICLQNSNCQSARKCIYWELDLRSTSIIQTYLYKYNENTFFNSCICFFKIISNSSMLYNKIVHHNFVSHSLTEKVLVYIQTKMGTAGIAHIFFNNNNSFHIPKKNSYSKHSWVCSDLFQIDAQAARVCA